MNLPENLELEINQTFPGEKFEELRSKLYLLDRKTIQKLGSRSQKGLDPQKVLSSTLEELYAEAKMLIAWQNLYKHLCEECAKDRADDDVRG